MGGIHTGVRLQYIQAGGAKAWLRQEFSIRWKLRFCHLVHYVSSYVLRSNSMVWQSNLFQHVLRRLNQLCAVLDQRIAATWLGQMNRTGTGKHIFGLFQGQPQHD
jgi:hypothetical protein